MIYSGQQMPQQQVQLYYQMSTTNKSFLEVHYYLKETGIKHNNFFLVTYDKDLLGIDPYDKNLPTAMKAKILFECRRNFWYFIREVVRIPSSSGTGAKGDKYILHRGNLALNFALLLNLNTFLELPRQQGKTISALIWYLWLYNFGTVNSRIAFLNKKMDDSKLNLQRMKEIRDNLPSFLQLKETYGPDGKIKKATNTVESLENPLNANKIKTFPAARNRAAAASLLRGQTIGSIYIDEHAFMPFNRDIYMNGVPAFKTAANNAKISGTPYGFLITTTPGFLTTEEGMESYRMKEDATPFDEMWYDMNYAELMTLIQANTNSSFIYIKYSYKQLGKSEQWFKEICVDMKKDWCSIKREVLLDWSISSENSPFRKEDLEMVSQLIKQPIKQVLFLGKYTFKIYEETFLKYPPIVGVDVSGGYNRDSSAITCIDSRTTRVFAELNCNYISTIDLARVIIELVSKYMPNAVVNVERNGGYGSSVLAKLLESSIKPRIYYEIKDKIIEERCEDTKIIRKTQKTKVYGLDSTKDVREDLIQILRDRMDMHKDKFISPTIYNELMGMEVKRNGKVEHSSNTHDDQVFSYLMALYVWYNGKDIMQRFGIQKDTLRTDQLLEEPVFDFNDGQTTIIRDIGSIVEEPILEEVQTQLDDIKKAQGMTYQDWEKLEAEKDKQALREIMSNPAGRLAYSNMYNEDPTDIDTGMYTIPDSVYSGFYNYDED